MLGTLPGVDASDPRFKNLVKEEAEKSAKEKKEGDKSPKK